METIIQEGLGLIGRLQTVFQQLPYQKSPELGRLINIYFYPMTRKIRVEYTRPKDVLHVQKSIFLLNIEEDVIDLAFLMAELGIL